MSAKDRHNLNFDLMRFNLYPEGATGFDRCFMTDELSLNKTLRLALNASSTGRVTVEIDDATLNLTMHSARARLAAPHGSDSLPEGGK